MWNKKSASVRTKSRGVANRGLGDVTTATPYASEARIAIAKPVMANRPRLAIQNRLANRAEASGRAPELAAVFGWGTFAVPGAGTDECVGWCRAGNAGAVAAKLTVFVQAGHVSPLTLSLFNTRWQIRQRDGDAGVTGADPARALTPAPGGVGILLCIAAGLAGGGGGPFSGALVATETDFSGML